MGYTHITDEEYDAIIIGRHPVFSFQHAEFQISIYSVSRLFTIVVNTATDGEKTYRDNILTYATTEKEARRMIYEKVKSYYEAGEMIRKELEADKENKEVSLEKDEQDEIYPTASE